MRRRLVFLLFTRKPIRPDLYLVEKLKADAGAILGWVILGCVEWQRHELGVPARIMRATDEYFEEEDLVGRWASERVVRRVEGETGSAALFEDWSGWCRKNGEEPGTNTKFSLLLKSKGWKSRRGSAGTLFEGVELLPPPAEEFSSAGKLQECL